jgi:hypothetical protein
MGMFGDSAEKQRNLSYFLYKALPAWTTPVIITVLPIVNYAEFNFTSINPSELNIIQDPAYAIAGMTVTEGPDPLGSVCV